MSLALSQEAKRPETKRPQTNRPNSNDDLVASAEAANLVYVRDEDPGIRRRRKGSGFAYVASDGKLIRDRHELARIRKLAIPPAYEDVWICRNPDGHIQAVGRDARGRKQYRYHPRWREIRDADKYGEMVTFGRLLPKLRKRIAADMAKRGLGRDKVLATVVDLLQTTLIRIGNEDYARENKSYGLTTLRNRHVAVEGSKLHFEFKGKSGKLWKLDVRNKRVANIVKACQDLPGQDLFQYVDDEGVRRHVTSADVNAYLREISGHDVTAKHFRTWTGTVFAAIALSEFEKFDSAAAAKRNIKAAIERVAARLGNTPTICRKCYIHPEVLTAYLADGQLIGIKQEVEAELRDPADLRVEEAALLGLLNRRLSKDLRKARKSMPKKPH